jgi:hypothetical protein
MLVAFAVAVGRSLGAAAGAAHAARRPRAVSSLG